MNNAIEVLDEGRHLPVVLGGDLDADPESDSVRFLTGRAVLESTSTGFVDAWMSTHPGEPGVTYGPANPLHGDHSWPARRIDYLMYRCRDRVPWSMRARTCEQLFANPLNGLWASDHIGLVAEFEFLSRMSGATAP